MGRQPDSVPAVLPADAVDLDSRLGRPLQTGDAAQQRGLAGAGGADDGGADQAMLFTNGGCSDCCS